MADHFVDLHLHSTASDGTDRPEDLPRVLRGQRIGVAALTDHDTLGGLAGFLDGCRAQGILGVTGVEFEAESARGMLHILGLGFPPASPVLLELADHMALERLGRAREILSRLNALGLELTMDQVTAHARGKVVGRPHFAAALVELGMVSTMDQAFDRYLGNGKPAHVPRTRKPPEVVIDAIHQGGGLALIAHPVSLCPGPWEELEPLLRRLQDLGLDGVEVAHSSISREMSAQLIAWSVQQDLYASVGSDYHGKNKATVSPSRWGPRRLPVEPVMPLLERLGVSHGILFSGQDETR